MVSPSILVTKSPSILDLKEFIGNADALNP